MNDDKMNDSRCSLNELARSTNDINRKFLLLSNNIVPRFELSGG